MLRSGNRSRDLILGRSWDGCGVESFLHPVVICGRSGERTADSHLSGVSGAWRGERILFRGQARDDCCVQKATGFLRRAVVSESTELYKIRYFAFLFLDRSIANADGN